MKKTISAVLLGVVIGACGLWTINTSAETTSVAEQPGSVGDPLVSKSYVDEQLAALVKAEMNKQTINVDKINALVKELEEQRAKGMNPLEVVKVNRGQILLGGEGTEVILRTGKATSVSPIGNGIPDLTGGTDLTDGKAVEKNHLLMFPKKDGRGIKPTSEYIITMVRGPYSIQNADGSIANP